MSIDCSFVEPQCIVVTKEFLTKFKYDKSKAKKYQLALTTNLGNLCVVELIGHLGANGLTDLLQQCVGATVESTFGNKPSRRSCRKRHCHIPWFDDDCHIVKGELKLWLKVDPDSYTAKHQENKLKSLLKRKRILWETIRAQHVRALAKVDVLSSGKSTGQRHPLWKRSVPLRFWKASTS